MPFALYTTVYKRYIPLADVQKNHPEWLHGVRYVERKRNLTFNTYLDALEFRNLHYMDTVRVVEVSDSTEQAWYREADGTPSPYNPKPEDLNPSGTLFYFWIPGIFQYKYAEEDGKRGDEPRIRSNVVKTCHTPEEATEYLKSKARAYTGLYITTHFDPSLHENVSKSHPPKFTPPAPESCDPGALTTTGGEPTPPPSESAMRLISVVQNQLPTPSQPAPQPRVLMEPRLCTTAEASMGPPALRNVLIAALAQDPAHKTVDWSLVQVRYSDLSEANA